MPKPRNATAIPTTPTMSPAARELFDQVSNQWQLSPPVATLLRLACEAITKAELCDEITAREGMTIGDRKGSSKPHPAALLSRDYRAQASATLQRILSNLEG